MQVTPEQRDNNEAAPIDTSRLDVSPDAAIILVDGVCNLCDRWVQFVIHRDRQARFRFAPLQSAVGEQLLRQHDMPVGELKSIVLVDGDRTFAESTAILRILRGLRFPWPLAAGLLLVPAILRDPFYRFVAKRRYRWFGKKECLVMPTDERAERFL